MTAIPNAIPLWPVPWYRKLIHQLHSMLLDRWSKLIFLAVVVILYSPTWLGVMLNFISPQPTLLAIATAYAAFWAGPGTPFFPLCLGITIVIRKAIPSHSHHKHNYCNTQQNISKEE